ncbi:hypothetical protein CCH79_00003845 [Gambusia affinis]|uniref:VLIG-type G domain-containing protein n=1 Tax=Gambusia affinis TaxID=33528 RepID=A0A315VAD4_GAMAF|nr:hypothetical protein CCH79_00003845 [Gambusia affinis]
MTKQEDGRLKRVAQLWMEDLGENESGVKVTEVSQAHETHTPRARSSRHMRVSSQTLADVPDEGGKPKLRQRVKLPGAIHNVFQAYQKTEQQKEKYPVLGKHSFLTTGTGPLKDNAQAEILHKLGLEAYSTRQLDSASVLNINTWTLEDKPPLELKDLPNTFLRRLWLLSEDARSTCCQTRLDPFSEDGKLPEEKLSSSEENAINPLDLVTSVFISADTFLQQEITVRMMQCKFAVPLVLPNADPEKPGDASNHERCLKLLCQTSSVVIIFCGDFKEKEKQLLESCKAMASKIILIDAYGTEGEENTTMGYGGQSLQECLWLPKESVFPGSTLSEQEVANNLRKILKSWVPDSLKPVTLEAAAKLALDIGLNVDESPVCAKAMATVEEILQGLDEGSVEFQQKQLPLQGHLWHKLAELDKEESKHRKSEKEAEPQLQEEKKDILAELKRYKMTPAMKIFIDALLTKDKTQRTYFLTWLKLRLQLQQTEKLNSFPESQTEKTELENLKHEANNSVDSDSFWTDSEEETEEQPVNNEGSDVVQCCKTKQEEEHLHNTENTTQHLESTPELSCSNKEQLYLEDSCEDAKALHSQSLESKTYNLGIEHFFREMGLIFELTHMSGSQNVLRLPKLAADLLLHGVPLELMDGDASNIPICWLGSIFAELNHTLRQEKLRTRVLTILGNHHSRNAVVLSGLFGVKLQEGWKRTNRGNISPHAGKEMETTFKVMVSSLLRSKECEFSQWEDGLLESMESWLMGATTKIIATKALDGTAQDALLNELKKEAQEEVKSEVHKLKSKAESYLMSEENLKRNSETFMPMLLSNMSKLQERVCEEVMQKLETINESHCSLSQIGKFETSLEREQEFKLVALVETSKSTNILLQDHELEEEFESVWKKMLSSFDFRPSESDDISSSVAEVLRQNLISRGLQKHMEKLDVIGQKQTSNFQVCDEHFGYRSRLKHMFEDNNKQQKIEAQKAANKIIEEYSKFRANKCSLAADFSESYITELLEMIENGLREKSLEIRSAFEVDLKIHLCNAACQDFQKLHDRFGKDKELLTYISETKNKCAAEFIYKFRKRDQCQRVAQAFISMVIKPLVLAYINQPLGIHIAKEIEDKAKQYQSPHAFHQSILEDLINEDCFESFKQYLLFYEDYRLTKIHDTVVAHLADTTSLSKLKQQRLGEVVGQIAAAVSQTTEGASGVLSDTKPLLERVCLILEKDANINVERESLNGPLFSITTDWDCFVKCLIELLATMRLGLSQEFNQNVDVLEVLNDLPILPQDHLLQIVRGCDKRCPLCKAPCDKEELDHEIHSSLLHRPKGILPHDICSPFQLSSSETSKDSYGEFMMCKNLPLQDTNWSDVSDNLNSQKANNYWRYVLVRFNEKFAAEHKQELAKFPEDWTKITKEEALDETM